MAKDDWIRAAMLNDTIVAELLVRIKQSQTSSRLKSSSPSTQTVVLPLKWSVRLPRSRYVRREAVSQRNKVDSTRFSPTTPFSWSGDASPSATADGSEESSRCRSKVNTTNEFTSPANSIAKRSRSKEKIMKLDFNLHSAISLDASFCGTETSQLHPRALSAVIDVSSNLPTRSTHDHPQPDSSDASEVASTRDGFLMLPDLNMVPSEEDYGTEMLYEEDYGTEMLYE